MNPTASLRDSPLFRKLQLYASLSHDDAVAIDRIAGKVRDVEAHEDILREGDEPDKVHLVLSGWVCRYKQLPDGRRQILAFLLPGDLCELRGFLLKGMDHSVAAIAPTRIAEISGEDMIAMTDTNSTLARALWWSETVSTSIEREWIVNLGQRNAIERVGHLLCELYVRLEAVGLTYGDTCEMPLTQAELSDTVGLSTVHMNRTLQELRAQELLILKSKTLTLPDIERLKKVSLFSPNYLHLDRPKHGDASRSGLPPHRMFGV